MRGLLAPDPVIRQLDTAAALLRERGWVANSYGRRDGGPMCLSMALAMAVHGERATYAEAGQAAVDFSELFAMPTGAHLIEANDHAPNADVIQSMIRCAKMRRRALRGTPWWRVLVGLG